MKKYYVSGVREYDGVCERVTDEQSEFWTVYQRIKDCTSEAMFDLCFRSEAEEVVKVLEERDHLSEKNHKSIKDANN
ncbi:hypothetical protein BK025_09045 [Sodalis sp. TME1]|nr:hypothetical protein BK025_09045 [Sodalis sp. TME1]